MKKLVRVLALLLVTVLFAGLVCVPAFAAEEIAPVEETALAAEGAETENAASAEDGENQLKSVKAIVAGVVILVVAAVGAVSMAIAVSKAADGSARQPEAAGNIRTTMMMGLVFIETAIIYALIIAILVIFVL